MSTKQAQLESAEYCGARLLTRDCKNATQPEKKKQSFRKGMPQLKTAQQCSRIERYTTSHQVVTLSDEGWYKEKDRGLCRTHISKLCSDSTTGS
jgi:hypothetical protein